MIGGAYDPKRVRWLPTFAVCCALGRIRTCDTRFRKPVLYPLSYEGILKREDVRHRGLTPARDVRLEELGDVFRGGR